MTAQYIDVTCDVCDGAGTLPPSDTQCDKCGGEGTVAVLSLAPATARFADHRKILGTATLVVLAVAAIALMALWSGRP